MLSTDSPLLTPPPATPAPGSNDTNTTLVTTTERQVTTRVFVRGRAQNAYVTVPESSPLLRRDENKLPALMADDKLPITDPRPFTLLRTKSYRNHSNIPIFAPLFIQTSNVLTITPLYNNSGQIFFHI